MDESSLECLRRLRASVQQVLVTIRSGAPFYFKNGRPRAERDDLKRVADALKRFCNKDDYPQGTYMRAFAASAEDAAVAFCGREAVADMGGISRYLGHILRQKQIGRYRYQSDLTFFLSRLRNKLTNRIYWAKRATRQQGRRK